MFGLKTGQRCDVPESKFSNVATFGATSRRSRDVEYQRRDVPERFKINVATLDINVATFQRMVKINVATLNTNVATFQRVSKSTSRR